MQGIYAIVNTVNGKRYVGSAMNIRLRWESHRRHLANGTHHCKHLQRAWLKHGPDVFKWEIVEEVPDKALLIVREQAWIDSILVTMRYNTSPTAGSVLGYVQPPEVRRKHAKSWLGKHHSDETRAKLSAAKKGIPRPPHLVEASAAALRGRKRPADVVERIAAGNRGRKLSDATRKAMSEAKKGRTWTEAQRTAIMEAKTAKPITEETRQKLSAATHRRNMQNVAKLTEAQVTAVRERIANGEAQRSIAKAFGIHQSTVWAIAHNKTWK